MEESLSTNDFNGPVIEEFRANAGRVGGWFEGARLILLTTTGARSGVQHTVPLGYLPDGEERILVIGSAGGGRRHPAWFHNLLADPRATVEDGVFTYQAEATVVDGAEREGIWARAVQADSGWEEYRVRSGRVLPVVALRQVGGGPPAAGSFGEGLRLIHNAFRRELGLIRDEVRASGTVIGAQLRVNCLTLCAGLGIHHRGEDTRIFPTVIERFPDAASAVGQLRDEHEAIAALLAELRSVISDPALSQDQLLAEVVWLTTEVEAHLDREEAELIPLLG